jgi:hypothetical protein
VANAAGWLTGTLTTSCLDTPSELYATTNTPDRLLLLLLLLLVTSVRGTPATAAAALSLLPLPPPLLLLVMGWLAAALIM